MSKRAQKARTDHFKWWYFVLIGLSIAAYSIYRALEHDTLKPLSSLMLAALCIAVGFWSRARTRRTSQ